jgi:hypothetical protein
MVPIKIYIVFTVAQRDDPNQTKNKLFSPVIQFYEHRRVVWDSKSERTPPFLFP